MRWRCVAAVSLAACLVNAVPAMAASGCPGNPQAIGTARVIAVDPAEHRRIGSMQYDETLPLADKEVVLTFDDGPLPHYTSRILEALANECVKATFFMVGRMARAYPDWVQRVYNAGHTVATHTNSHPSAFRSLSHEHAVAEVESGIAAVEAALGDRRALAPFFRFPGLNNSSEMEAYLAGRGVMTWSADIPSDDWRPVSAETVLARSLTRLGQKGRGVILMHDIQARTAQVLPDLLRELKARGYRVVHVVPAGVERPKTVTEPQAWVMRRSRVPIWPVVLPKGLSEPPALPAPSALSFGFPDPLAETVSVGSFDGVRPAMTVASATLAPRPEPRRGGAVQTVWPAAANAIMASLPEGMLPAPSAEEINLPASFGGKKFEPAARPAPVSSDQASIAVEEIRPAAPAIRERRSKATTAQAAKVQTAAVPRQAEESGPRGWARRLNWFHLR